VATVIMGEDVEAEPGQFRGEAAIAAGMFGEAVVDQNDAARASLCLAAVDVNRRAGSAVYGFSVIEQRRILVRGGHRDGQPGGVFPRSPRNDIARRGMGPNPLSGPPLALPLGGRSFARRRSDVSKAP